MPRLYTIRTGCAFRQADGSKLTGGQQIELEDDVARDHAEKLEPLPADGEPQESARGWDIPAAAPVLVGQ